VGRFRHAYEEEPAGQLTHAKPVAGLDKVPAVQFVQLLAPTSDDVPDAQRKQGEPFDLKIQQIVAVKDISRETQPIENRGRVSYEKNVAEQF